jgi:Fungal specific transcription factor domain
MALNIVEGLGVHSPEHPTLTPVPSPEFISVSLEREAIRRIFWYIHLLDLKASIYFKKPMTFPDPELRLRLPVDETSFELGVHSTLPGESQLSPDNQIASS